MRAKQRDAASGVWGGPLALSRPDGDLPGGPSLAVNAAGDAVVAAYGPNLVRLRKLKKQYDPENVFHHNLNIEPA